MLQRRINTAPNRYPGIFRTVRDHIASIHGPGLGEGRLRILSFGCSTGIEVLSIRAYFPEATIFGCDRDPDALNLAVKNTRDDPCRLFLSTPESVAANGPYDLIFAMSVFCQYPDSKQVANLQSLYPFELYARLAGNLIENLREGGLFCVMNSNYLFRDLVDAGRFDRVRSPLIVGNGFIDKFARDGRRLTTSFGNKYGYSHKAESDGITDDDLRDCVFKKVVHGAAGGGILTQDGFLRTVRPAGVSEVRVLPDLGESLERAISEQRVAMARKTVIFADETGSDLWACHEWHKAGLDGRIQTMGEWWVRVSPEQAGELSPVQAGQKEVLRDYIKKARSVSGRLKSFFGL